MRTLIVEDDFTSRILLQSYLSRFGECHVAVNGTEAVEAYRAARTSGIAYDLICMDILMPEMDGNEALRQIRTLEGAAGIGLMDGVKIIMTTGLGSVRSVSASFGELCNAYLVKPIDTRKLLCHLMSFGLVQ